MVKCPFDGRNHRKGVRVGSRAADEFQEDRDDFLSTLLWLLFLLPLAWLFTLHTCGHIGAPVFWIHSESARLVFFLLHPPHKMLSMWISDSILFFLISVTLLIKIASWFFFLLSLSTLLPVWLLLLTLEEVVRTWLVKSWRVHSQWMEIPVAVVVVCLDLVRVQCLWNFSKPWLNVKGYSNPLLSYLQLLHINM